MSAIPYLAAILIPMGLLLLFYHEGKVNAAHNRRLQEQRRAALAVEISAIPRRRAADLAGLGDRGDPVDALRQAGM